MPDEDLMSIIIFTKVPKHGDMLTHRDYHACTHICLHKHSFVHNFFLLCYQIFSPCSCFPLMFFCFTLFEFASNVQSTTCLFKFYKTFWRLPYAQNLCFIQHTKICTCLHKKVHLQPFVQKIALPPYCKLKFLCCNSCKHKNTYNKGGGIVNHHWPCLHGLLQSLVSFAKLWSPMWNFMVLMFYL